MENKNNLDSCPYCGSGNSKLVMNGGEFVLIRYECEICGASGPGIKYHVCRLEDKRPGELTHDEAIQKAIDAWNKRPGSWISVKDRLPKIIGNYLVYDGNQILWSFFNSSKKWCSGSYYVDVIYWQPLPNPPGIMNEQ